MRIWSVHPSYLDTKGLTAVWREVLLAKKVLLNKTTGYKNHPQLTRFRNAPDPFGSINYYLAIIYEEATLRGYSFDDSKFEKPSQIKQLLVTRGQINYELEHLQKKLQVRAPDKLISFTTKSDIKPHPLFKIIDGDVESWEKTK